MSDWYVDIGRQRLAELNAGRAQAQADLELAKSTGDTDAASTALQNIADIDAAQANLAAALQSLRRFTGAAARAVARRTRRAADQPNGLVRCCGNDPAEQVREKHPGR
jgi:hypothetical protein